MHKRRVRRPAALERLHLAVTHVAIRSAMRSRK
jgi:hypothetical protein